MKKVLFTLPVLALLAVSAVAQDARPVSNAAAEKIDAETRALVARVYPAFVIIGGGSGVCVSEDGYFITNHHVWTGAAQPGTTVLRMAGNRKQYTADAVGADPRGDIVMGKIRVGEGEKLPFVKLGDSDKVNVGDICLAIGNPFLQASNPPPGSLPSEPTVTLGTVTANHRFQGGYSDAIQIDTPINPGNSGGPSFNIAGEVIGINGRNISSHGRRYNTGAGYAIPSNQIRNFMDAMKAAEGGSLIVRHGLVGGLRVDLGAPSGGAPVREVEDNSHAMAAGFKPGDLITAIDGKAVHNGYRYYGIIGTKPRGSQFTFTVKRGEKAEEITARNNLPVETGQMRTIPRTADQVPLNENRNEQFRLPPLRSDLNASFARNDDPALPGVKLEKVNDGVLAAAGLQAGDVITVFNGRKLEYRSDLTDVLIGLEPGKEVKLTYVREGKEAEATVVPAKAPEEPNRPRRR